jgi:hypothetical protein
MKRENLPRATELANDLTAIESLLEQCKQDKVRAQLRLLECESKGVDPVNEHIIAVNINEPAYSQMISDLNIELNEKFFKELEELHEKMEDELENL